MPNRDYATGVPSKAAIFRHPIHPMLVPFPVALLPAALVTDIVFHLTGDAFWARASFWLIAGGLVTGLAAALFGLVDFLGLRPVRELKAAWLHFFGNVTAMVITLVNLLLRWDDPVAASWPTGLILSAVVTGILVVTGWLGGELSYRYKIGVLEHPDQ